MKIRRVLAVVTLVTAATVIPQAPAVAAAACPGNPPQVMPSVTGTPWPQQRYDLNKLADLGVDGSGVTVAVIDSGVEGNHPQLRGRVDGGGDAIDATGQGVQDCVGHGTAVASLIGAQKISATEFRGLAPGARILSIRVSEQEQVNGQVSGRKAPDGKFAEAITTAVNRGARVINLSVVLDRNDPAVRDAVAAAVARDVVVVAAVGNSHQQDGSDPIPYPAAYDGVVGVGAVGPDGLRVKESQVGTYVDLVAPGSQITVALPGGYHNAYQGTSFAAPFVSATAALLFQYRRGISAREVVSRLFATADPAPGGPGSQEYGRGMVNPQRALTETVANGTPVKAAPLPQPKSDAAAEKEAAAAARTRTVALILAGVVGLLAALVILVANIVPRGRRRGWRPGTRA
jgi:membrane-anchored mycosin MYCP